MVKMAYDQTELLKQESIQGLNQAPCSSKRAIALWQARIREVASTCEVIENRNSSEIS